MGEFSHVIVSPSNPSVDEALVVNLSLGFSQIFFAPKRFLA